MIKTILLVGAGGFFGSILRYLISWYLGSKTLSSFPFGTFTVNIAGSFILGILMGLALKNIASPESRLFLATGFCGGFTTFSTFSYEFFTLLQDGQFALSLFYSALSLAGGLLAVWAGYSLTKLVTP